MEKKLSAKDKARNARLYSTYGITLEEYKDIYKQQKGQCLLCERKYKILNVDHVHIKGFKKMLPEDKHTHVRGLLCFRCNKFTVGGLEIHKNARQILNNIVQYGERYMLKGDK
jgi:hypothetical protein